MPYISNLERESEARGREAGKVEMVVKQLSRRNQLSEETLAKIKALPIRQLKQLGEDLMDFMKKNGGFKRIIQIFLALADPGTPEVW